MSGAQTGSQDSGLDLSIIIPCLLEGPNLAILLPLLRTELATCSATYEILLVVNEADPLTVKVAKEWDARVLVQRERGYGGAVRTGFVEARGEYWLTMDADLSHPVRYVPLLWAQRENAEVIIASRYAHGGSATMPLSRYVMSRTLNLWFSRGLGLPARDVSSGFRLVKADVARGLDLRALDFDLVLEFIARVHLQGWRVNEVPFNYEQRGYGRSHARVLAFGCAYARLFASLWVERKRHLAANRHSDVISRGG